MLGAKDYLSPKLPLIADFERHAFISQHADRTSPSPAHPNELHCFPPEEACAMRRLRALQSGSSSDTPFQNVNCNNYAQQGYVRHFGKAGGLEEALGLLRRRGRSTSSGPVTKPHTSWPAQRPVSGSHL
ncbi:hypothetical protein Q8A67_019488 [Cirrhinus molitorella]|uniref:Uncharacterized protein n=1 Tax=Cirrhinus molitorella TaxID=172907 RepID=A0AA88TI01_9TELE|nr:hypothetical protein Q8A67_019488 [Cirrhinus molitorella]